MESQGHLSKQAWHIIMFKMVKGNSNVSGVPSLDCYIMFHIIAAFFYLRNMTLLKVILNSKKHVTELPYSRGRERKRVECHSPQLLHVWLLWYEVPFLGIFIIVHKTVCFTRSPYKVIKWQNLIASFLPCLNYDKKKTILSHAYYLGSLILNTL